MYGTLTRGAAPGYYIPPLRGFFAAGRGVAAYVRARRAALRYTQIISPPNYSTRRKMMAIFLQRIART
ncbi:MAG: hypothetical protein LC774_05770, partial [Acidobacteria bacterium]|nr:hypothetical protein [Acidobacteriota bacterium]